MSSFPHYNIRPYLTGFSIENNMISIIGNFLLITPNTFAGKSMELP
jgi:hypothetical protein